MRFDEAPYVSDREAFTWARIIESADPRLARRIRRGVWKRRAVIVLSLVTAMVGLATMAIGVRIIIASFVGRGG